MQKDEIANYISHHYRGVISVDAWGEQSFFYNPERNLPRGVYFATLKAKDGENDQASGLDRKGVYRFNFGVTKPTFESVLGPKPSRPAAGGVVKTGHNFRQLNTLMPHPVYGWMSWVCILNPDRESFDNLLPLLEESYALAVRKYDKRVKT
ncbi:hypothetical protein AWR36_000400 [Microbulbifer flavimaris]|uniref:DUF6194 domain-containing protein n=1 Tax=Microbulbifer flavimaris TaxID=1781068 RepID=A0ABX4I1J3_9GAMM|nr:MULTISPECIES: DUF6194 family protein [Microbulbifer]KUJ84210.1 hypothetical protein AVO43_00400 [Microbulbifer sp. ZGT114]PCO06285.1 hypothetical protein AWR36_000400 [Microbulbifer flavimaris]